jgi:hypothetical protein
MSSTNAWSKPSNYLKINVFTDLSLEPDDFIFSSDRSEKYTIIEIIMFEGRSLESKKRLIGLLYKSFASSLEISKQDLEIVMLESPRHNQGIRQEMNLR